jgi:D-3-phosphoglycerate dehydrogenase
MSRYRVVVTDQVFPSVDLEREMLAGIGAELVVADGSVDKVLAMAQDADALLNTYLPIDAAFVSQLRQCKIIARYGIGVDNVDLAAAKAAGIAVTNVPDYSVEEVAAHALALLLAVLRRVPEGVSTVHAGQWNLDRVRPIRRLSELTVGLVGFGRIARRFQRSLAALDMRCVVFDPYLPPEVRATAADQVTFVDTLDQLLDAADVVSLHAPLTPQTRGLIGAAQLARLGPQGVLINTSRGPLVDMPALLEALRGGVIRAAGLDVVDVEPPTDPTRFDVPGLLVTPHMAYYSEEAITESQRKATTQVINALTGRPLDYQVN